MFFLFKIIISYLLLFNLIYSSNFNFTKQEVHINFQDELVENISIDQSKINSLFAAGLSFLLPGSGQFYLGDNIAGSIYMAVEASLWLTRDHYLDEAVLSSDIYKEYAKEHWSFSKWIRDYHNPTMLPVSWSNSIPFIAESDYDDVYSNFLITGLEPDSLYFDLLWDQGHSAEFDSEGIIYSTEDEVGFKIFYQDVCNTSAEENYICLLYDEINNPEYGTDEYNEMLLEQIDNKINRVIYDHHLYEGIGKYNMFFAGWNDSVLGEVVDGPAGDYDILASPYKLFYENVLRAQHKENNSKAGDLLSLLFVNRAISVFNILLNESRISISSDINPSKYANNEIKLSLRF